MKILLLVFPLALSAAPLRVVTFNIETGRDTNGDITDGLNDPGTIDYNSVRDILSRINADVVCLQELTNSDVSNGTQGGTNSDVHSLATDLGLPHVYIPSTAIDFELRNAILSRYPFLDTQGIGTSAYMNEIGVLGDNGNIAKDVTRAFPAVVIDVPGASAPATIITLHNKSSSNDASKFRRAVELARLADYLERNALDNTDNIIVLGDFNLSGTNETFTSEPLDLPRTYNRGVDIPLPITYSTDPDFYFPTPWQLVALDARAMNGSDDTYISSSGNGATLDYLLPSPAMNVVGSEIYRSELDDSNATGLPKSGNPLPAATSTLASDHYPVFADLELPDFTPPPSSYLLTDQQPSATEGFEGFSGQGNPPRWTSNTANWRGLFSDQMTAGTYSYGSEQDRSPGFILGDTPITLATRYENQTTDTISSLKISYLAEHWVASQPGSADRLQVHLTLPNNQTRTLPELETIFHPTDTAPSFLPQSALITNLNIAPGESLQLTFTAIRGAENANVVQEVFLNELHYDNEGNDTGEFIEIVLAPGFASDPAQVAIDLYNGNDGSTYGTHPLATFDNFANPTLSNGYRLYHKAIAGIQNGAPDGLAISVDGLMTSFLSYEGTFKATDGPANGLISTELPASQNGTARAGFGSIGFTGAGSTSSNFNWIRFDNTSTHTPGQPNPGQSFTGPAPLPPQAFAIDNVTVAIATPADTDNDRDGDPDVTDPDDDNDTISDQDEILLGTNPLLADSNGNGTSDADEDFDQDGQSNGAELHITLTNPRDGSSRFAITMNNSRQIIAPTLINREYTLLQSADLLNFQEVATYTGNGQALVIPITPSANPRYFRIRVTLAD